MAKNYKNKTCSESECNRDFKPDSSTQTFCRVHTKRCRHDELRRDCRICSNYLYCEHNTKQIRCLLCNPDIACRHGRRPVNCHICNSKALCEHGVLKGQCIPCGGRKKCEHGKRSGRCLVCSPDKFCEHKKRKDACPTCNPLCPHGVRQGTKCRGCSPHLYCSHGSYDRRVCFYCSPLGWAEERIRSMNKHARQRKHQGISISPENLLDFRKIEVCYFCEEKMDYSLP